MTTNNKSIVATACESFTHVADALKDALTTVGAKILKMTLLKKNHHRCSNTEQPVTEQPQRLEQSPQSAQAEQSPQAAQSELSTRSLSNVSFSGYETCDLNVVGRWKRMEIRNPQCDAEHSTGLRNAAKHMRFRLQVLNDSDGEEIESVDEMAQQLRCVSKRLAFDTSDDESECSSSSSSSADTFDCESTVEEEEEEMKRDRDRDRDNYHDEVNERDDVRKGGCFGRVRLLRKRCSTKLWR